MTVRDTILQEAERSQSKVIQDRVVLPASFYEFTQSDYFGKRALDILFATIGLVPLVLMLPFLYLAIKLSSRGPVFFKQPRTGKNGKAFMCYKIRTMHMFYDNPNNDKPALTQKGDVRIFAFGQFLRKSNLDELPQLFNVLKGDMSLVGPRPYMEEECAYWNKKFDDFYYRYAVRPGLTGLSQVNGLRGGTFDEDHMRQRLNHDLIYLEKQSLWLDLKIIFRTVLQMLHLKTNAH